MSSPKAAEVLLVGCGKMGAALLKGWLASAAAPRVTIVEPGRIPNEFKLLPAVSWVSEAGQLPPDIEPDIVVLAVKPQIVAEVLPHYASLVAKGALFLSIAAGRTIKSFEAIFGDHAAIIRAMPNTPAAIGRGISVCCTNDTVSDQQKILAEGLLSAVGAVDWVEDEALIDAVTAVSGSGPAYVFLLVETLAYAGIEAGLPKALAWRLAGETVSGTGALLAASHETPAQLRRSVTSPNGTTQAALEILMAPNGLQKLMSRAVEAATRRSRELAS